MSDVTVSVFSEVPCHLGEGPSYDARTDTLFWFDILVRKLLEKPLSGDKTVIHDLPLMTSALAAVDDDKQILVTEKGLQLRHRYSSALEMLAEVEADRPDTRSNDARPHPCGALWFGTMGKKAESKAGAIYWFFRGEVRRIFPDITIPNAISFSPDGGTAYFADTWENRLYRIPCDPETGLPLSEPTLFLDGNDRPGGIDGSVIDTNGTMWNARFGGSRLEALDPQGKLIRRIDLPAGQVTCPAFVGPNADRLAVTSAFEHMDAEAREADPHAGKTFLLDLEVKGRLDPPVRL